MVGMSTGERRRVLLGLVIAAQFAVPTIALMKEPPTRFGFQMYSAQGYVDVAAIDHAGEPLKVPLGRVVAGLVRPEMNWVDSDLAERVCAAVPTAAEVSVRQPRGERTVEC